MPADKIPFGKYIRRERYNIESTPTTEKGVSFRYYPTLYLSQSPQSAFAEFKFNYSNYRTTTGQLQENEGQITYISTMTTVTTGEVLSRIYREIDRMYDYITLWAGTNEREVTYEKYLKSPVVAVVDQKNASNDNGNDNYRRIDSGQTPVVIEEIESRDGDIKTAAEKSPVVEEEPSIVQASGAECLNDFKDARHKPPNLLPNDPTGEKIELVKYPFVSKVKQKFLLSDFIFGLSLNKGWAPPDTVRKLLKEAKSYGWVKTTGDGNEEMVELLGESLN